MLLERCKQGHLRGTQPSFYGQHLFITIVLLWATFATTIVLWTPTYLIIIGMVL